MYFCSTPKMENTTTIWGVMSTNNSGLCRLPAQPEGGKSQTYPRTLADFKFKKSEVALQTCLSGPAVDVPNRVADSHINASPLRLTPHETDSVALEEQLGSTRITRKGDPHPTHSTLIMVASGRKVLQGQP